MDKNSNTYTFIYAAVIVVVVAAALATTSLVLKEPQLKNIEIEKKQNILASVNKGAEANTVKDRAAYIESEYAAYIVESFIVNGNGEQKSGNAFDVDMKPETDKIKLITAGAANAEALRKDLNLPIFVYKNDDGSKKYIIPVRGVGLWGPIWGYLSFHDDFNTVYGAIFDHKSETPGLGAEISRPNFAKQFIGKQIFENGNFVSIKVIKDGAPAGDLHCVDAISGGSITCNAVTAMLHDYLGEYRAYFEKMQHEKEKTNNNNNVEE